MKLLARLMVNWEKSDSQLAHMVAGEIECLPEVLVGCWPEAALRFLHEERTITWPLALVSWESKSSAPQS